MKVFALDISTKTGWSYFINGKLKDFGLIELKKNINDFGNYPENFTTFAKTIAERIKQKFNEIVSNDFWDDGMIVIEETSKSRGVYQHKILEFIHCEFLRKFEEKGCIIKYVRTGQWRKTVGLKLSKEDKEHNKLVREKKAKGLITKKHLSVRLVNKLFDLNLKLKNNNEADAIIIGHSTFNGVIYSDGIQSKKK